MRAPVAAVCLLMVCAEAACGEGVCEEVAGAGAASAEQSAGHVSLTSMSNRHMAQTMQMDDAARFGKVLFDRLEWRDSGRGEGRAEWDGQAWYGGDYNKLWVRSEGKFVPKGFGTALRDADVEVLWNRVISRWWNVQFGGRRDVGAGRSHTWATIGIEGLAPQWFETEATIYVGDQGRTAARLKAQYDLLLTQRLVLQPFAEVNLYGRAERGAQIGSGLSDLELSMRLRYEVRREFAPYVGFVWLRRFGQTADLVRVAAGETSDLELALGVRVWL